MTNISTDKRVKKGEQTRLRLLHTAIVIIAESGVRSVSAAKLADAAKISKSNVFHHFKTIDELLLASLQLLSEQMLNVMRAEFNHAEQLLEQIGAMILAADKEQTLAFKAFLSFYHEALFDARYAQVLEQSRAEMLVLIRAQLCQVAVSPLDEQQLDAISTLLLSLWDGLGLHRLISENTPCYEDAWNLQAEFIRQQLTT